MSTYDIIFMVKKMINSTKIIIADDMEPILIYLEKVLSNVNDFEIVGKAKDGKELIELILDKKPDLVITDIEMPQYSGIQVAKKTNELGMSLKYILITGNSQYIIDSKLKALGIDRIIRKPIIDDKKFVEQIKSILKKQQKLEQFVIVQNNKEQISEKQNIGSNIVKFFKKIFKSK